MLFNKHHQYMLLIVIISAIEINAQYLNVSEIRLVGGNQPYEGRVELNINGIWGTVCDDSFDIYDARVMCRMLNLKAFIFVKGGTFGQGNGPIFAQRFYCGGSESSLQSCRFLANAQCDHSRDVGIVCSECGEISTLNGAVNLSSYRTIITITCNDGYTINNTQSICNGGSWSPSSLKCVLRQTRLNIDGIRLVNGSGIVDGRVELLVNGTWGTVCSELLDGNAVRVMCKMLGFQSYSAYYGGSFYTGEGNGPILITQLGCKGTENHISECSYKTNHTCRHIQDVGIACYNSTKLPISGVRLANGTGLYDGRAELLFDGQWGTICQKSDTYFYNGIVNENTICKMMNLSLTYIFKGPVYGEGGFPILIQNLQCLDNTVNVTSCSYSTAYGIGGGCSHKNDLTLICTPCGLPPNVNETTVIFNGSELTASCYPGFTPTQIKMRCLSSGRWDVTCTSVSAFKLNVSSIRLQDDYPNYWPSEGHVRIRVNGHYGGICKNKFDAEEAAVLCRMMKLTYVSHSVNNIANTNYQYGVDKTPTYVDNLECTGNESHINECTYDVNNNCSYWDQVAIKCTGYHLNITDIRLSGSTIPYRGRIEVKVNNTWGTICQNYFSTTAGYVVCRMLGYGYLYSNYFNAYYGPGTGPIYIDRLSCGSSSYSHINNCTYAVGNVYGCTHNNDVSVACYGPKLNITEVRLVNGTGPYNGRAELKVNGVWGTICDRNFDLLSADIFCQELHLRALKYYIGAANGAGSGPIYMEELFCSSSTAKLADCNYLFLNSCTHGRDVSVVCSACVQPDLSAWDVDYFKYNGSELYAECFYYKTYVGILRMKCNNVTGKWFIEGQCKEYSFPLNVDEIRLAGGGNASSGRVELKTLDTWGTVCDHSFGMKEADTICRMIGFSPAKTFRVGAYFGKGTGPIFVDELKCGDTASHINNCTYNVRDNCQHSNDVSVICTDCGSPVSANANVNSTRTSVGTVVKVTCNDGYRMSGNDVVVCQNNGTWTSLTTCTLIDCGSPVSANANVNSTRTSVGTVVKITCKDGYRMSGNDVVICQNNGTWTSLTTCTLIDCGSPVSANANVNSTRTSVGTVVKVTCKDGYRMSGNDVVVCQNNGTWTSLTTCTLIDCGSPVSANANVNSTRTSVGTVVKVTCKDGYRMSGNDVVICQNNGTWTSLTTCTLIDCGSPVSANANVNSTRTSVGTVVKVTCKDGYRMSGNDVVICQNNGTWTSLTTCTLIDCGDPTPANGIRNTTNTSNGTVVKISCKTGYDLFGDDVVACQKNNTWSSLPTCRIQDCGSIQLPYGKVAAPNGTSLGASVTARCDPGYNLHGSAVLTCTLNGWNDTVECTKQDCGSPQILNGKITSIAGTLYGDTASLQCNTGHDLIGGAVITCQDGGRWSNNTRCSKKDCGSLALPTNGFMDATEGTMYNSNIKFSCNGGFLLLGSALVRCKSDGKWSADPPKCLAKSEIGGSCQGDENCLSRGALCRKNVCSCLTGIHDNRTNTCDAMSLFPYGLNKKDTEIPATSECGSKLKFSPGVPLFKTMHKDIFVCKNGMVTFDNMYSNPTPPKNKESVSITLKGRTIVAPFHGAIDTRTSGPVYYRTYDILNTPSRMKEDAGMIKYIEGIINKFANVTEFETSFLLIATWTNTRCARHDFNVARTSTFQVLIVSDGRRTFVINIYGQGLMQWRKNDSSDKQCEQAFVGYTVDSGETYTHPFAFTSRCLELDATINTANKSKFDVAGIIFKPMTTTESKHENHAVDCIKWYNDNKDERQRFDYLASMMPECPCNIMLSEKDPWFWRIGLQRFRKDLTFACVDMPPNGNFAKYGKSCCYDLRTWSWVYERPLAGGFKLYHPQKHPAENYRNDELPKYKCCELSDHCHLYYKLRPSGSCYQRSPYNYGTFWGDPHFQTLDGLSFTYNGLGEFTMLQIRTNNFTFDIQARTERALKQDGHFSDATVFCAFAAKDSSSASVHVEMNKAKTGLNLFANKVDLTNQYNAENTDNVFEYTTSNNNLHLAKRDGALSVLFPTTGISLSISVSVGMLSLNTLVPQTLRNLTGQIRGLLGNYDGDPNNDFTMPNGTVLPANITDRRVFDYGMTWSIDENNSAFVYEEGKNHSSYHNDSYVPRFLDEADPAKIAEAERVCNGSQNKECVFDYVFTEKPEVAEATNNLKAQAVENILQLAITVPSLVGCHTMNATIGQNVSCMVEYNVEDNIEFIENNVNAVFEKNTSTIVYLQTTDDPVDIQIISKNSDGRSSSVFSLNVILCTGCNGHGNCTDDIREDLKSTRSFKYSTCLCEQGYEGIDCEKVFDGCAASPCSHGRNCTKLSAAEQKTLNRTYNCSACPSGYYDDGRDCKDCDECSGLDKPCQQNCVNTDGSYLCTCNYGFRKDVYDASKCRDINECEEASHNCSQLCNNTVGGFECGCYSGYTFNTSAWMCVKNEVPTCNDTMIQKCVNTSGCTIDKTGTTVCFCNEGFELDASGTTCNDVNECQRNVCPQDCLNTNGSFECVCYPGYKLVGKTTCQACEVPYWGENCLNKCPCIGRGAERCDPVRGCMCEVGWKGYTCNEDINECEVITDACTDPHSQCINLQGSYTCDCLKGYRELENGTCADLDECSNPALNDCIQTCSNTDGGYACGCQVGFTTVNKTQCKDIDECSLDTYKCQQKCVNNQGTYSCSCHLGYTLNDDRRTCEKQLDRFPSEVTLTCSHYYLLEGSNVTCRCYDGYSLGPDIQSCSDVNECEDPNKNQCSVSAKCVNTDGSYLCECPYGSKLENDGRTCSECDEYHFGVNCSQTCSCLNGYCSKTTGCICTSGWAGNQCDKDLNECDMGLVSCTAAHTVCVNTLGSAVCSCRSGYFNHAGNCKDIDECNDTSKNVCDHICVNTDGSYRCECHSGFLKSGEGTCKDVNECVGIHACDQRCGNTIGSYRCSCLDGYRLNVTDRRSCFAETSCTPEQTIACGQHATCSQTSDGPVCTCVKGFVNVTSSCHDIDECMNNVSPCAQNCTNTVGSFTCSCASGFYLREDNTTCQECENWTYGANCGYNCSCNRTNTYSCDKVLGKCYCKYGWDGISCNQDIDECQNTSACPDNSKCYNKLGSYLCACNDGYFKSGNGRCEECDDRHFGKHCFSTCVCNVQNTQDCNDINGACVCKAGWTGSDCSLDVDECIDFANVCQTKINSRCVNSVGSYDCLCKVGFEESEGGCREEALVVQVSVKIEHDLPEGTNLSSSYIYDEVESKVIASLVGYFKRYTAVDIIIKDIRLGSIDVDFDVVSVEQSNSVVSKLARALWDLGKGSNLVFDEQDVIAMAEQYKGLGLCDVYEGIRRCVDNYRCVVELEMPICRLEGKQVNWSAIIGGAAAGGLLIVVAAVTTFLYVRCKRGNNKIQRVRPREDYGPHEKIKYQSNFQLTPENQKWQGSGYPMFRTWSQMTISSQQIDDSSPPYLIPLDASSKNI